MPPPIAPSRLLLEPMVRAALLEDLGRAGDLTTDLIVPAARHADLVLAARRAGVVAGLPWAQLAFALVDPAIRMETLAPDGAEVAPGQPIARLHGPARGLLTAERAALNFVGHLGGIATATQTMVRAARPHRARIVCTRKTLPGLRIAQKYAVRAGGGFNHRFGLDDAILIKDNHVALAGGVAPAVARVRAGAGHLVKIELEVDTLEQLEQALSLGVDAVLLDNMAPDMLRRAVAMAAGRAVLEASGGVTPESVAAIAATGVDLISAGWLTHSAPVLDVGLDEDPAAPAA